MSLISGIALEIVSDKTQEGFQFVNGFDGIGGKSKVFLYFSIIIILTKVFFIKRITRKMQVSRKM